MVRRFALVLGLSCAQACADHHGNAAGAGTGGGGKGESGRGATAGRVASAGTSSAGTGSAGTSSAGSTATGQAGSGSGGSGRAGSAGHEPAQCTPPGQRGYERPDLAKSCSAASDCFVGLHTADCCGSQVALAYSVEARSAFETYERGCAVVCDCLSKPTVAEDDRRIVGPSGAIAECVDGSCRARRDPAICSGAQECISDSGACVSAKGPVGDSNCRSASGDCYLCMCASPETPIATPTGERAIASLAPGDLVYSSDGSSVVVVPIARVARTPVTDHHVVQVQLENGRQLSISPGHPTADGRTFAQLAAGAELDGVDVVRAEIVAYAHAFTHDILPASSTGIYYAAGVAIGSTLVEH